ncbi:MAG TPA: PAS domain S-box protein [Polyangiaceae bacterium]|nr:PAS domain S-box protein [Polyangiaceae bacterium]
MKRSAGAPESSQSSTPLRRRIAELEAELARVNSSADDMRARLNLAMSSAGLYWWEWDVESDAIRHFGHHPALIDGSPERANLSASEWTALVHPDDRAVVDASIAPCLRGEVDDWRCELRVKTTAGDFRWVANSAQVAERDSRGRVRRVLGTTQDVHARKSAEERARRDAELFSNLHESIICTDLDGIVTSWNEGAYRLYGWTEAEMVGRSLFERFPPEERERVQAFHDRIVAGEQLHTEWYDTRKDGSRVWVEARVARYSDSMGRPAGVLGIARDIGARRETELTLRRDAHILAQLKDVVVCTDADARVVYWNQAAERIFGWKSEELLGRSLADRFPPHMKDVVLGVVTDVLSRDQTPPSEWEDYRKDGSRVWIHWRAHRLKDAEGNISGMVSVGTDMTEQRRAAEEQKRLQQQLFHAQKMETIGTLAGGIAHDFNNILAAIVVYSELAMGELQNDERSLQYLSEVKRASQRAKELVRRILAFSRFNEPDRRRIDLRTVIEDAVRFVRPMLPATLEIRLDLAEGCSPSRADQNQIHQVLLNLLSNAAQAMKDGTGQVVVRLREVEFEQQYELPLGTLPAGSYLSIAVEDNGQGIDPPTLKRIFDPFFTTKKAGEGTGLGLSVVHGIIHNHEGSLAVESVSGQGSTFTFYLPTTAASPSLGPASVPPTSAPRGNGERVLVVDDEDSVARLTTAALETLGYTSVCYTSADDVLREFERAPESCRLLITDQTMPRTTGLELAQRLRAQGHQVPILIVSGFSRALRPEGLSALGRVALLNKPFEIQELAIAARRLLTAAGSQSSSARNDRER